MIISSFISFLISLLDSSILLWIRGVGSTGAGIFESKELINDSGIWLIWVTVGTAIGEIGAEISEDIDSDDGGHGELLIIPSNS